MMDWLVPLGTAFWLGILTSISPCPLATNIAAISYIGKRVGSPRMVFVSGFLYNLGRMIAYVLLGVLLVASVLSIPEVARFLQQYMNKLLGPILIVAGMFLLELLKFGGSGSRIGEKMQRRVDRSGVWGAFLLGFVFALSFCPVSAALFFGSLIPLSIKHSSAILFPSVYGIGTGLPVIVFAILIAMGTRYVGGLFEKLTQIEVWARRITGVVFILVGIYYCLTCIFGINIF
ncbi:MAG: sulfite exporter TauE/SafE family protein [candidate division Zixibacteria bacterium]|nr:sulfite exporter TauE/SafE family protein [candidate division Zixibacteria bacterium]MBU1470506.1 sulfite exporter TauE/SafE family protein [candidate division Zixibacteria bacterium]MBU2626599.1 sulfite exporter TauE/SafE family protein [candidate division Zixibacteria bacterium]